MEYSTSEGTLQMEDFKVIKRTIFLGGPGLIRQEPIKERLRFSLMLKILSPAGLKDASHHEFHSFKQKNSGFP